MLSEPQTNFNEILGRLRSGFQFSEYEINEKDFSRFVNESKYPESYKNRFGSYYMEKLLEHYLSLKLLNINSNDVLIDIAADQSFFAEYVHRTYNIEAYQQDLIYPKGITSSSSVPLVGGDAAVLPFRDNYFSVIPLHCSLEHFEQDSDILFMIEAQRVLKPEGRMCILPLYLGNTYHAITDPAICDDLSFDGPIYERPGFGNRQCRVYSIDAFRERLIDSNSMDLRIHYIKNAQEIDPCSYCCLAAVFTKLCH